MTNIRSSSPIAPFQRPVGEKIDSSQDDQSKEEEEDKKQREKSWKMMKWSFILFGCSTVLGGSFFIYELVKPQYDENGKLIEDEYSNLPFFQKTWMRLCRELTYYKKVKLFLFFLL